MPARSSNSIPPFPPIRIVCVMGPAHHRSGAVPAPVGGYIRVVGGLCLITSTLTVHGCLAEWQRRQARNDQGLRRSARTSRPGPGPR